jgi:hypothetical protein
MCMPGPKIYYKEGGGTKMFFQWAELKQITLISFPYEGNVYFEHAGLQVVSKDELKKESLLPVPHLNHSFALFILKHMNLHLLHPCHFELEEKNKRKL